MGLGSSLKVIGAGLAWRTVGRTGPALIEAFQHGDEQDRTLAGMSLVKAGEKSVRLIADAIRSGDANPETVRLLADIGGPQARAVLEGAAAESGDLGEAAATSLKLLDQIEAMEDESGG